MIAIVVAVLIVVGLPICRALDRDAPIAGVIGQSFLLGSATAALSLYALTLLHIAWSLAALSIAVGFVSTVAFFVASKVPREISSHRRLRATGMSIVLDVCTLLLIAGHLSIALHEPPREFDYFGIWGFKGRLFFEARGIDWGALVDRRYFWIQPGHPLFVPLIYDVFAVAAREWNDRNVGAITTIFGIATILIVRRMAEQESSSSVERSLFSLAAASTALSLWIGLAEGPFIAFATTALLLCRRGVQTQSFRLVSAGAVFLGCAAMTKNEGMGFILAASIALLCSSERRWRSVAALWPALPLVAPWIIAKKVLRIETDFMAGDALHRMFRQVVHPQAILRAIAEAQVGDRLFWIGAVVTVVLFARRAFREERFLTVAVILQLAAYVAQNFLVPWDAVAHVMFSWARLIDQVAPAVSFLAMSLLLDLRRRNAATMPSEHAVTAAEA